MQYPAYWNHNVAYFDWVKSALLACEDILDVGCGGGCLIRYLDDGRHKLTGIDIDEAAIRRAMDGAGSGNTRFICSRFESYSFEKKFNAVVFVASLHHMDMATALRKAKSLLKPGGMILVVGLAKPSSLLDWGVEIFRVIPCALASEIRHMQSSEENDLSVSYEFPAMNEVRRVADALLPQAKMRYGLFYRYLLYWKAQL